MFKKVFNLLKILRKLSVSGAIDTIDNIKPVPGFLKFIIYLFSIGSAKKYTIKVNPLVKNYVIHLRVWVLRL